MSERISREAKLAEADAGGRALTLWRHLAFAAVIAALFAGGLQLRNWTWKRTEPVRFEWDIRNGYHWGERTLQQGEKVTGRNLATAGEWESWRILFAGYVTLYDAVEKETANRDYGLDYPPLRLLIMSAWAKKVWMHHAGAEIARPEQKGRALLRFNLVFEALSAVAMFFLVRFWVERDEAGIVPSFARAFAPEWHGRMRGLLAAAFVWLNPSVILTSHGWPQWDVWIIPFYLFAALAASAGRWFWCGALLAIGAMLKGQILIVAPFFLLWPLFQKEWRSAAHLLLGFAAALALLLSPWLLNGTNDRLTFIAVVSLGTLLLRRLAPAPRWRFVVALASFSAFAIGAVSGGSFGWLRLGFIYGADLPQGLFGGTGVTAGACYNLPSLLAGAGFSLKSELFRLQIGNAAVVFTLQWGLRILYVAALAACALWAGRRARVKDARTLLALAAPWLLMLALLAQMRERYSIWMAAITAVALALSVRLSILHLIFSLLSTAMIAHVMLAEKGFDPAPQLLRFLDPQNGIGAWIFLICAALYFAAAGGIPEFARRRIPRFLRA
ncbi:MAG TPA: hypothetical protein VK474_07545 [Chthoniobacterales bacterium]|nr:hypothetical protein [Chthoniobacterales bacterium]